MWATDQKCGEITTAAWSGAPSELYKSQWCCRARLSSWHRNDFCEISRRIKDIETHIETLIGSQLASTVNECKHLQDELHLLLHRQGVKGQGRCGCRLGIRICHFSISPLRVDDNRTRFVSYVLQRMLLWRSYRIWKLRSFVFTMCCLLVSCWLGVGGDSGACYYWYDSSSTQAVFEWWGENNFVSDAANKVSGTRWFSPVLLPALLAHPRALANCMCY